MGAEEVPVRVPITASFDPRGTSDAARGLGSVGAAGDAAKTSMEGATVAAEGLKTVLMELLLGAEALAQFKEGAKQIMDMEQSMIALERATTANGHKFEDVKSQIEDFANAMKDSAGLDDDVLIPALVKLYNATGDVNLALTQGRIAADLSVQYHEDITKSLETVLKASQGFTKGLKEYGIKLDENLPKEKVAAAALEALSKAGRNSAAEAHGLSVELAVMGEHWEDFRNNVVEKLLTAFVALSKGIRLAFVFVMDVLAQFAEGTLYGVRQLEQLIKAVAKFVTGQPEQAKMALDEMLRNQAEYEKKRKALDLAAQEAHDKIINDSDKRQKALFQDTSKAVIKAHGETNKAIAEDDSALTQALIREGRERYLAEVEAEKKRSIFLQKIKVEALGEYEKARRAYEANAKSAEEEALRRARDQAHQIIELKKLEAQQGIELAQQSVALLGSVFGDSKEIAIAQAIINTYEGATKALSQGGIYGAALAAIVIAAGFAQIAKIESTNPGDTGGGGQGFDDPDNDAAAYAGGRRWARDVLRHMGRGAMAGFNEGVLANGGGGGTNTTVNSAKNTTYNVVMPGLTSPAQVRQQKQAFRDLETIGTQVEGSRVIARRR